MEEVWKKVHHRNIKELYSVSNIGNVRNDVTGKILYKKITTRGYYAVSLQRKSGGNEWIQVHQLVARAHLNPLVICNEDMVPDHLNGNKLDNRVENLKWKTRPQNTKDAFKLGLINNSGEHNANATITDKKAHEICKLLEDGYRYGDILCLTNIEDNRLTRQLLVRIKNGLAWKHISKDYNFSKSKTMNNDVINDVIEKLPMIRQYIGDGYNNAEIARMVWGENHPKLKSKAMTVSDIRHGKTYSEY